MVGLFTECRRYWGSYLLFWLVPPLHILSVQLTPRVPGWHAFVQYAVPAYLFAALFLVVRACVRPSAEGRYQVAMAVAAAIIPTVLGFAILLPIAPALAAVIWGRLP